MNKLIQPAEVSSDGQDDDYVVDDLHDQKSIRTSLLPKEQPNDGFPMGRSKSVRGVPLNANCSRRPWEAPTIPFDKTTIIPRHRDCPPNILPSARYFFTIDPITVEAIHTYSLHELWNKEQDAAERENRKRIYGNFARPIKWVSSRCTGWQSALVPRPICGDMLLVHDIAQGWGMERRLEKHDFAITFLTHLPSGHPVLVPKTKSARLLAHACYPAPPKGLREILGWIGHS